MVCFLHDKVGADLPETETEIYAKFTTFAMLRMLYRSTITSEFCIRSFDDLSQSQKDHYISICKLAFEMTLSSKQVMDQTQVEHFFPALEEIELFGLITVDKMATTYGVQKLYTFPHLTFQEFLAAYYVYSLKDEDQMKLVNQHGKTAQMQQVWKFYCGLDKSGSKFETLIDQAQHGTLFNMQCSFESQQPCTCDSVVKNSSLHFADSFLTTSDFTAMAFVISNTKHRSVLKIVLDECTIGLDGVNTLKEKTNHKKLSCIKTLCYHGYDCADKQLSVVNKLVQVLPCLEVLDITRTNLGGDNLDALTNDLHHHTLKIVKVTNSNEYLFGSAHEIARRFRSQCSIRNICFSGSKDVEVDLFPACLPFCFYCNCEDINFL